MIAIYRNCKKKLDRILGFVFGVFRNYMEVQMNERYCNTAKAAEYLGVSVVTLHRYVKSGKLIASRPGGKDMLFDRRDLDDFIMAHKAQR